MQKILTITWLTWKAAIRFRLFLVIAALLLAAVIGLPLLLKDDGTARGFTQILLTYTLGAITALLGLSTLWLSCGTLARDIEECQMQVLVTKPVARWQIWLGKWLGLLMLNAVLLALSGACIYGLLEWRSHRLPAAEQKILREEVLVARGSVKPSNHEREIETETERILQERLKDIHVENLNVAEVRNQIREQVKADFQVVPSGDWHGWQINLGPAKSFLHGKPLRLRIKFNSARYNPNTTFIGIWQVGVPNTDKVWRSSPMSLAADTYHEFEIPPDLFDDNGLITILFANPDVNGTALLFPLTDGIELLYPEGGFALNFVRGLGIILCWMGLLAAVGLAAASFLSFPVATFFSLAVMTVVLSSGTLADAVDSGTIVGVNPENGVAGHSAADVILLPAFKGMLTVVNLVKNFSPVDALSSGRSISWTELGTAFAQMILLLGGLVGLTGIILFQRRELATAQGTQ